MAGWDRKQKRDGLNTDTALQPAAPHPKTLYIRPVKAQTLLPVKCSASTDRGPTNLARALQKITEVQHTFT